LFCVPHLILKKAFSAARRKMIICGRSLTRERGTEGEERRGEERRRCLMWRPPPSSAIRAVLCCGAVHFGAWSWQMAVAQ
jgi:hypothetical protein